MPVSLSPIGVCNRAAGAAGRPVEEPAPAKAWRWEEIREAGVAAGWIFVNGARFCPDSGHLTAPELIALARRSPEAREKRIRVILRQWFRPAQLRRRAQILEQRTIVIARLNAVVLAGFLALTLYVGADFAARLPLRWSVAVGDALPWLIGSLLSVHAAAVVIAWRAARCLKPVLPEKRRTNLWSAAFLPPQALRLRTLLGDGFFPAQHPVAVALAFGSERARREHAFATLADVRWPFPAAQESPLEREIVTWFRNAIETAFLPVLQGSAGLKPEELLAPPVADAAGSCSYCPRCRDQFIAGRRVCPHGVPLEPLAVRGR